MKHVVMVAHGTGNSPFYPHIEMYQKLLLNGFGVFACDLDGHGRHSTSVFKEESIWSCLDASYSAAKLIFPNAKFSFYGYSLGGALALDFAIRYPEKVEKLVLVATPVGLKEGKRSVWSELKVLGHRSIWQAMDTYGPIDVWPALGRLRRHLYPLRLATGTPIKGVDYLKTAWIYIAKRNLLAEAAKVSSPTLLLYGERDGLVATVDGESLCKLLANGTLKTYPGETHLSMALSSEVSSDIADFLQT